MGFRLFSNPAMPIAINFGSSSAKLIQLAPDVDGGSSSLLGAAELSIPESAQQSLDVLFSYYEQHLPLLLREGKFKGRRVLFSVPDTQTIVQHMQLPQQDGVKRDVQIKSQLQVQMGIAPSSAVVRSVDVAELNRGGQARHEVICFAIPREIVMRYVTMLEKFKLEVVGVHTEAMAMVRAFDHIHRRSGDENLTSMYVDLGYGGTRVAIAHGKKIAFARSIQVGGKHFDQRIAQELECDLTTAQAHRLAMQAAPVQRTSSTAASCETKSRSQSADTATSAQDETNEQPRREGSVTVVAGERRHGKQPVAFASAVTGESKSEPTAASVDMSELLDTISDELSMCLRYHRGLFPQRPIDRAILVGGEARQSWLCQHIVRELRIPAQLGDPIARFRNGSDTSNTPGLDLSQPQPGWAVACGLAATPVNG